MVVSSELNLIPYPVDNHHVRPLALLPSRGDGRALMKRYDFFRYPNSYKLLNFTDGHNNHNNRYSAGRRMESSTLDQLGVVIDIYA
jgi:hypothetical protein